MKMTGAQEQKMKCICWELATVDFEIRRDLYSSWTLGECSNLTDKNKVLTVMLKAIVELKEDFDVNNAIDKQAILNETKCDVEHFFKHSSIYGFGEKEYNEYLKIFNEIETECLYYIADSQRVMFKKCDNCSHKTDTNKPLTCTNKKSLIFMYDCLYKHRNRCAHNLMSYQQNLPSLKTLNNDDYLYENYFVRFSLLIIIDKIIMTLYKIFANEANL
ncbi:MAG: hypothetical protein RSB69_04660 [Odoribacter sp.]